MKTNIDTSTKQPTNELDTLSSEELSGASGGCGWNRCGGGNHGGCGGGGWGRPTGNCGGYGGYGGYGNSW